MQKTGFYGSVVPDSRGDHYNPSMIGFFVDLNSGGDIDKIPHESIDGLSLSRMVEMLSERRCGMVSEGFECSEIMTITRQELHKAFGINFPA